MKKLTKDEARERLAAAKKSYRNRAITFDEYIDKKRELKKVLLEVDS
jgi:hypothetical protein